jgi:hypothetical protein
MRLLSMACSLVDRPGALILVVTLAAITGGSAAEPHDIKVDFSVDRPALRALHGINKGPLAANGIIDVTEAQKLLRIPFTRLHDCHHPNPDVVDIHAVFPDPDADPSLPESYDFPATDEYLAAVRATGAEIIYRLGESIEHQTVKRHVIPPGDPERWAAVCAGVVRHYNKGWAEGFQHAIRYWEIWNEPENRPAMWTGTDARFLDLYAVTARSLRKQFPDIRIGGPAFGYCGRFDGERLDPSAFCTAFLERCRREALPLDFFSWHCYTDRPDQLAARARAVRRLLDAHGFTGTESHLNEWNYLPGNSWDILSRQAAPEERQRSAQLMTGAPGGAFLVASLIELQDAPVDVCNIFHGATGIFGLFTEVGAPNRNYHALMAFTHMLDTPKRARVTGGLPGKLAVLAGTDAGRERAAILVANLSGPAMLRLSFARLPWGDRTEIGIELVDGSHALEALPGRQLADSALAIELPPPCVALITLRAADARGQ